MLKATAIVLAAHCLPVLSMRCYHIEGRGGAKAAVRFIDDMRGENTFVFRTDVKSYYASIDHDILLGILEHHVPDGRVLDLLRSMFAGRFTTGDSTRMSSEAFRWAARSRP